MATIATLIEHLFDRRHEVMGESAQAVTLEAGQYLVGYFDGQLTEIERQIIDLGEYPLAHELEET